MFKTFGKALRSSLSEFWENSKEEDRLKIIEQYGENLMYEEDKKLYFKNNDFLPNFDNIIFVEGIAGSGKSTGVLNTWSKLMALANPDFVE
jgi:predicted AAA+ superfamily ATPase